MIRNPLAQHASELMNAYASVRSRLPRHTVETTSDGLVIQLVSGLDLTITHDAAHRFNTLRQEAEHG